MGELPTIRVSGYELRDLHKVPWDPIWDLPSRQCFCLGSKWRAGLPLQHQASGWRVFDASGFNKLGLMQDDTIYKNDDVKEAIRRLPETPCNDTVFHIKRALDLTVRQLILPKEQWTKYEEDKFYLEPYLKEVIWERKEREEWAKK
eukprot:bmy_01042T0